MKTRPALFAYLPPFYGENYLLLGRPMKVCMDECYPNLHVRLGIPPYLHLLKQRACGRICRVINLNPTQVAPAYQSTTASWHHRHHHPMPTANTDGGIGRPWMCLGFQSRPWAFPRHPIHHACHLGRLLDIRRQGTDLPSYPKGISPTRHAHHMAMTTPYFVRLLSYLPYLKIGTTYLGKKYPGEITKGEWGGMYLCIYFYHTYLPTYILACTSRTQPSCMRIYLGRYVVQ